MPKQIPSNFKCPITCAIMLSPCSVGCIHSFEEEAITGWLKIQPDFCCPNCNTSFTHKQPMQNVSLKGEIQRFFIANPEAISLVDSSIKCMIYKKDLFLRQIKESQRVIAPPMYLDLNIVAEWQKILSACRENNAFDVNSGSFNRNLDPQELQQYFELGLLPIYTAQRPSVPQQTKDFKLLNVEDDVQLTASLREARTWYKTNMTSSFEYNNPDGTNNKLRCCIS